jgi:methionine-rich copper-binding protein CopC
MNPRRIGLAAAVIVLLAIGAAGVQLVSAHSRPIRFDPPAGAVLNTAPERISGWFTSELRNDPNWNYLQVKNESGARVDNGQLSLSPDRHQMSVGLNAGLGPGRYIVQWRTFDDADGEIFGDCYVFYVGQEAADKAIADKFRLDAGSSCQRIEFNARNGTPTANATLTPGTTDTLPDDDHDEGGDDGSGVPFWAVIAGAGVGMALGLVGGRLLTGTK